jgi:hypothetical protein
MPTEQDQARTPHYGMSHEPMALAGLEPATSWCDFGALLRPKPHG